MPQKDNLLKRKRIFVGFNSAGAAGIYAFTRVLRRRGYRIDFYGLNQTRFDMPVDYLLKFSSKWFFSFWQRLFYFFKILGRYDIWHLNFLEAFFFYPLNLAILKIMGKKIILTCRGADVRDGLDFLPKELFSKTFPSNWASYYRRELRRKSWWKRFNQKLRIKIFDFFADEVILTGPFLISSVPRFDKIISYARIVPHELPKKSSKKMIILHVPSEPMVKGTEIIAKNFRSLQKKYKKIDFKILEPMVRDKLLEEMAQADIIVDQLMVGWYGGQAVEAMAMGKIVVAFLNPPYFQFMPNVKDIPIWNTNPWSFGQDLENLICLFPKIKKEWEQKSRKFAQKYHSAEKVAEQYLSVYRRTL